MPSKYLEHAHQPDALVKKIKTIVAGVRKIKRYIPFDVIVVRGISGASVAYTVSFLTGIPVVQVRKDNESSHGQRIEGYDGVFSRYLIIDDIISTGATVEAMIDHPNLTDRECVAILLYRGRMPEGFDHNGKNTPVFSVNEYAPAIEYQLGPYKPVKPRKKKIKKIEGVGLTDAPIIDTMVTDKQVPTIEWNTYLRNG